MRIKIKKIPFLLALFTLTLQGTCALANIQKTISVHIGPTHIPHGNALGKNDITVQNSKMAIAFAVDSSPPWGVSRGGIIDVAEVSNGVVGSDRVSLLDFMPNNWSSWPTTYQRVSIEKQTPLEVIIKTERDWETVALTTIFRLQAGSDKLHITTRMINKSDTPYKDLLSGYVLWPDGGYLFGVPGMQGITKGKSDSALADWSGAYDHNWVLGLHTPFADFINYEARDRYQSHSLPPGSSRQFEAWLQVGDRGELAPLVAGEIELNKLASGRIEGKITAVDGSTINKSAIIVSKKTKNASAVYTFALGDQSSYSINLPAGKYELYATAKGYSNSAPVSIEIAANSTLTQHFGDLKPPGKLHWTVKSANNQLPLDARITIEKGDAPVIKYFGEKTFFTQLHPIGTTSLTIAPGKYTFKVASAEGFNAKAQYQDIVIKPGSSTKVSTTIEKITHPQQRGWYSADMHHHSDVLDGFTDPVYVMRSELAAGLDVTFLSDHDSVINNREMNQLATSRQVPFIPATEFSPSWAHFNAYPLDANKQSNIDSGTATVQELFSDARRMGAEVIQVNHPYMPYGYFHSQEKNQIPGGYDNHFDLIEISPEENNNKTIKHAWQLWNKGEKHYLSAGSDTHDVWKDISGKARMYVHIDGKLSVDSFITALKKGHAYATMGPLIYPEIIFGQQIHHPPGNQLDLQYTIEAVNGLKKMDLIEQGEVIQSRTFNNAIANTVAFIVTPKKDTWYSVTVEDAQGRQAFSNPIWVNTTPPASN